MGIRIPQPLPHDTTTALPTSTIGINEGKCYRIQSRSSGLSLNVPNNAPDDGTTLKQNTYANSLWQQWRFTPVGDGYYRISFLYNNKGIQVTDFSSSEDALLQQ